MLFRSHRRFIALWLIDPHQRIISTGNVPPQQQDWWAEAVFGNGTDANSGNMSTEILELLGEHGPAKKSQKKDDARRRGASCRLRLWRW